MSSLNEGKRGQSPFVRSTLRAVPADGDCPLFPGPKTYWRSLAELADAPEFRAFAAAEFAQADDDSGLSRRRWLQLMGASLALAGVGGCRWQKRELLPLVNRPPHRVPGKPERYATAMDLSGSALGLLVTCVDGRPIKIEGNPKHPQSLGATSALAQASILTLYDPDRSENLHRRGIHGVEVSRWEQFAAFARARMKDFQETGGIGLAVLSEASSSPTLAAMRGRLQQRLPEARWFEYDPLSADNERLGSQLAFGKPYRTHVVLRQAGVIVCLEADLLGSHPAAVQYAREFAERRNPTPGRMNRLYSVESGYSVTGAAADHRLAVPSGQIAAIAAALEREVSGRVGRGAGDPAEKGDRTSQFVQAAAEDLLAHRGRGVVAAGPSQPREVHAAVHRINAALGNVGKTVWYTAEPDADRPTHWEALRSLAAEMAAGRLQTLLILGGNPVYDAPADLSFAEALNQVPESIHLSQYRNETSRRCLWHLPEAHWLESWGDARAYDGTYSVVQPMIEPLRGGKSGIEVLELLLSDHPANARTLVQATFQGKGVAGPEDFERRWEKTLHDGLLEASAWRRETPSPRTPLSPEVQRMVGPLEIVFCRASAVYDGRFANNGWLQETPDPLTKLTWDNAALISPATAQSLGIESQTLVRLKYGGRELEIPAYVMPGQADGSVSVALGYGRTAAGRVGGDIDEGIAPVGADAYRLRLASDPWFAGGLTIEPTGKKYPLAVTQDHFAIDAVGRRGREEKAAHQLREASLEHYRKHPDFARHLGPEHPPLVSLWSEPAFTGHRWAMSVDLTRCIGCNACVVACQAENNVPVVGKERVLRGREMHWMRVDRYFRGPPDAPAVAFQPVMCQQCELAPCEQVCPVAATVHSQEGLNDMVYNRCVGTRYCANNCPYKVRRFNFFNYHKNLEAPDHEILKMRFNPEVTIRHRGVMEKCTYCVQRIQAAKIEAKNRQAAGEPYAVADGRIQTACQQACPTGAIVFGDLSDAASQVAIQRRQDRAYAVLEELNVKPRTTYLARIRNPHPGLEGDS